MDQELIEYLSGMESRLGAKLDAGLSEVRREFDTKLDTRFAAAQRELGAKLDTSLAAAQREFGTKLGAAVKHFNGRIQLLAELVQAQGEQHERRHVEIWTELSSLGRRMTHLEARVLDLSDRIR